MCVCVYPRPMAFDVSFVKFFIFQRAVENIEASPCASVILISIEMLIIAAVLKNTKNAENELLLAAA